MRFRCYLTSKSLVEKEENTSKIAEETVFKFSSLHKTKRQNKFEQSKDFKMRSNKMETSISKRIHNFQHQRMSVSSHRFNLHKTKINTNSYRRSLIKRKSRYLIMVCQNSLSTQKALRKYLNRNFILSFSRGRNMLFPMLGSFSCSTTCFHVGDGGRKIYGWSCDSKHLCFHNICVGCVVLCFNMYKCCSIQHHEQ